jgi:hypothetical protein
VDHEPRAGAAAAPRAVVLVEGRSDQAALETLAGRRGRVLGPGGISVVPMGARPTSGISWTRSVLAGALDLTRIPRPLDRMLAHAG